MVRLALTAVVMGVPSFLMGGTLPVLTNYLTNRKTSLRNRISFLYAANSGGAVLGTTMAAMLLGHWYLNAPGMPLAPLWRLIGLLAAAIALRSVVCACGLGLEVAEEGWPAGTELMFLVLRWLGGLFGTTLLAVMAWQTLKIPNTQSATGILYVAVITTFLGELVAGLLSASSGYPL